MHDETTDCPKCHGDMIRGFTFETHGPRRIVTGWVEGAPERTAMQGVKVAMGTVIPVAVFRCSGCGFLESYARAAYGPA
jgi:hypothetical protein